MRIDPVTIRPAGPDDLTPITEMYNHYIEHTHVTFDTEPFRVEHRADWYGHYAPAGPHRLLVAERLGTVIGYATSSPFRPKPAYRTSVETSVYVHPDAVGQGIGRRLYDDLLGILEQERIHRAYAGIAMPNEASVALHVRCGFTPIGTYDEVGYKFGRYFDVAWFQRRIP
jgi:phosphinothricin acetyltransferase